MCKKAILNKGHLLDFGQKNTEKLHERERSILCLDYWKTVFHTFSRRLNEDYSYHLNKDQIFVEQEPKSFSLFHTKIHQFCLFGLACTCNDHIVLCEPQTGNSKAAGCDSSALQYEQFDDAMMK
ncbi:conserved hypothetical protein [Trichinella spiralis]|uniref:hypothetical protein n=1 Tax=Trichinella spiralis TaxID=6334 RepID=UPI0001EFCC6C|nr:conserved hypothetical protein [Trichinella spiralis]